MAEAPVVVIGAGVVGAAVAYTLARRGVTSVLLEAEDELARGASGTNSGILHTGFDSKPGELETEMILRAARLRPAVLEQLAVPVIDCGARLEPRSRDDAVTVARLADNARANDVEVVLAEEGALDVPGESVTDPVAYTHALAAASLNVTFVSGKKRKTAVKRMNAIAIETRPSAAQSTVGGVRILSVAIAANADFTRTSIATRSATNSASAKAPP